MASTRIPKGGVGSNQYEEKPGSGLDEDATQAATADTAAAVQEFSATIDPRLEALQIGIEANVPVLLWGEPGTGKTSTINGMCEKNGWASETVLASIREPTDFSGLPIVADGKRAALAPPDWAERLDEEHMGDERGVLFLDEISTATPATQSALLRVALDRVVGDTNLGSGVRVVAAANDAEHAAGGWDLAPALANRFCHLEWKLNRANAAEAMITGKYPTPTPLAIPVGWESRIRGATAKVGSFLMAHQSLMQQPPQDETAAGRGWPSQRAWTMAARLLACADASNASGDARTQLLSGMVGDAAAGEYLHWEKNLDLPNPEDILKDPMGYQLPAQGDQLHATVYSIASAVSENPTRERWEQGVKFYGRLAELGKTDFGGDGLRILMKIRPEGAVVPPEIKAYIPKLKEVGALN